jgi:hypothetical protein
MDVTNLKEGDTVSIGVDGFHVRIEKIGNKKAYVRFKDIRQFKGPGQWIEFDKLIKIDKTNSSAREVDNG